MSKQQIFKISKSHQSSTMTSSLKSRASFTKKKKKKTRVSKIYTNARVKQFSDDFYAEENVTSEFLR